jgi:predicted acylesterase/phospholipase RssA
MTNTVLLALIIVCVMIIVATTPDSEQYEYMTDRHINLGEIYGLCISSGGFKGYAFIGVIQELMNRGMDTSKITHFAGCSAGSLICAMLACGITPAQMLEHAKSDAMQTAFKQRNHNVIGDHFEKIVGSRITFRELHNRGKYLICPVTELSMSYPFLKCIYYSPDTSPDMRIGKAIALSSNIPLILSNNIKHTDGGMSDPYPIRKLQEYVHIDNIIGIRLDWDNELHDKSAWLKLRQQLSLANEPWAKRLLNNRLTDSEKNRTIIVKNNKMKHYIVTDQDLMTAYREGVHSVNF